jgi:Protein of unknown function (DUF1566)
VIFFQAKPTRGSGLGLHSGGLLRCALVWAWGVMWALACVFAAGTAAQAQQVCDTQRYALSSPTSRFQDHGDGTVTDTVSRLMWMRCSEGQQWTDKACDGSAQAHTWAAAQVRADAVNQAGHFFYNDWRVPSLRELSSITERQCQSPRLNLAVFPATPSLPYWTATSRPASAAQPNAEGFAFVMGFGASGFELQGKNEMQLLRLVRHAQ